VRESLVPVRVPYRLDLTAIVLRRLSTNVVDVFDGLRYRRLLGAFGDPTLLTVEQTAPDAVRVRFDGPAAAALDASTTVRRLLGTEVDLEPFYARAKRLAWLDALAVRARGVKPPRYPTLWETICNAVVYQQVSIHAAGAILRRVIERFAAPYDAGEARIYPFPPPEVLRDADPGELRSLGLSANKIAALKASAAALADRTLDEEPLAVLPTPALLEALVAHKGIGPWTAAVIALRGFGRLDVFPRNDSGASANLRTLSADASVDAERVLATLEPQQGMLYYHLLLGRLSASGEAALDATPGTAARADGLSEAR